MTDKKPFEIARETLKQLTTRKLSPTPLNYQRIYNEIAELPNEPAFPADRLRDIALALPTKTPGQQKQRGLLESAINQLNWEGVKNALMAYGGFSPPTPVPSAGIPLVDSVLPAASKPAVAVPLIEEPKISAPALTADFFGQIARLIEYAQPALGHDDERFNEQTQTLVQALRQPDANAVEVKQLLVNYGHRLSFAAEDQAEIKAMLLKLLHLIIENISHLSVDDAWLKGQADALMAVCVPPLSLRQLDEVEQRLKDVIFKQTESKNRVVQAQEEMRQMLATFIERLASMTESTSGFHTQMETSARLIEQAKTIEEIAPVLKEVVSATRHMAQDSRNARDSLQGMKQKVEATEVQIAKLHQELDRVSAQARHDPLTGALNRQGLDEAVNREVSKVRRTEAPLCMALLDIDNFKKLNDTLGHATGDMALTHLAQVTREVMRPQDTLARYGGEEFVILLPDTPLEQGIAAMTRLQRELTKRFFMAGTEKVLITFSAGVAQLVANESGADAIKRADHAMYLAKRAGKNRVLGG
ncbi:MAG: diguanylate cyclase [Rhodoferax sp.]|nr:diguanylate cyclase [Betaproteobacteria bacterium]NCN97634.1 diguanylate cyclase [Rhodoferax sp.]PIZ21425.1 MAG: GGDEF domain-containing protein [Comamonadaceae bacterium CG_4_10_14_0_8_um_filter_57_29]PJC19888.1 MAG: GGDEF domain-containing protein [Comamonadaceae bacterium CG_4_9_14_0_8_um_filter_57_21]NCP81165.1 diguanylate cyclase [Rhodoferax sp.]